MRGGALSLVALLGACQTTDLGLTARALTVPSLLARFEVLDGQEIWVRGWVGGCEIEYQVCGLFAHRSQAKRGVINNSAHAIKTDKGVHLPEEGKILLKAKVVVTCRNDKNTICVDRVGYLEPIIVKFEGI
ncbi:hypothetical protein LY632_13815 [Erythrobacter sp. SDW2]|uniref:hypothetical protein n=1 Tax=Erythrobacter sp. SDW2 TaxID=2907154 RepID=UPI001F421E8D|nr:hypothetical protein [Erythrobacter sp. SDW2]UIP06732.1 hypothetical protein LY632_13815 [Erythrobacter sp. SDW2]